MSRSSVSTLSDRELLGRLKALVEKERATTIEILLHLNEVERRKLHLKLGYPSLFEYCTGHLGYSNSAAGRRIAAARCARGCPEVLGLLEKNELTLGTVSRVASVLTQENREALLERVRGKSEREVDEILSGYRAPLVWRDRVRPVRVAVPAPRPRFLSHLESVGSATPSAGSSAAGGSAAAPLQPSTELQRLRQAGTQAPSPSPARLEQRFHIQFLASEAFMKKFEKARALLSHRMPGASYEAILEAALDAFLDRHSPERKQERREKRKARDTRPRPKRSTPKNTTAASRNGRHIPARIRDAVFARDQGRCTYVGVTGKRCGSTHDLQIDHIEPYGRGGRASPENLRLLCGKHNRLEADRVYGANAVRRYRPRE